MRAPEHLRPSSDMTIGGRLHIAGVEQAET